MQILPAIQEENDWVMQWEMAVQSTFIWTNYLLPNSPCCLISLWWETVRENWSWSLLGVEGLTCNHRTARPQIFYQHKLNTLVIYLLHQFPGVDIVHAKVPVQATGSNQWLLGVTLYTTDAARKPLVITNWETLGTNREQYYLSHLYQKRTDKPVFLS